MNLPRSKKAYKLAALFLLIALIIASVPMLLKLYGDMQMDSYIAGVTDPYVPDEDEDDSITDKLMDIVLMKVPEDGAIGIIEIPTLSIEYAIKEGTGRESLCYTIGHFDGSANIGEVGNCVLAGHRGGRFGTFFKYLPNIQKGDEVKVINKNGDAFLYKVREYFVTNPYDMDVVANDMDELTLITCDQKGTMRFIVKCDRAEDTL